MDNRNDKIRVIIWWILFICVIVLGSIGIMHLDMNSGRSDFWIKVCIASMAVVGIVVLSQSTFLVINMSKKRAEYAEAIKFDDLTGLPSKTFHKLLCENIIQKEKGTFAYAVIDVSEFKFINSAYGYEYGNMVLKYIADIIKESITKEESATRSNGDHFAVLLKYTDTDELADRISAILDKASNLPKGEDNKGCKAVFTCGVYLINKGDDINRIRARANVARKNLKKSIANQVAFYNEEDFKENMKAHELEAELAGVIEKKELVVFLQPKYGISNEEIIGAEALVRWQHKEQGLLSPNMFIPIAEKNGFIKEIDYYVFTEVCRKIKQWQNEGKKPVKVSVNFSRVHMDEENFVDKLVQICRSYDVPTSYLEIELTESAVYDEMKKLLDVMYLIKEAGFGLSMDDFGAGYSSLHLLREMPVDVLKLDKGFMNSCDNDNQREQKVISHVISMAKDLEISVLAEGVETESQKTFLEQANCDMIQGYYYAKPMPMEEFDEFLLNGNRKEPEPVKEPETEEKTEN